MLVDYDTLPPLVDVCITALSFPSQGSFGITKAGVLRIIYFHYVAYVIGLFLIKQGVVV